MRQIGSWYGKKELSPVFVTIEERSAFRKGDSGNDTVLPWLNLTVVALTAAVLGITAAPARAQSLDLGVRNTGLSIGNSERWNGVRVNWSDRRVEEINGINLTLWRARNNHDASVTGISLGLAGPEAGRLTGIQIGGGYVVADRELHGISLALVGVGSGDSGSGIMIAGLGAGAGDNMTGIAIGGLGAGAGDNMTGFSFGGLGAGAGDNMRGIAIGGLGAGAGDRMSGIAFGGLGAGAGDNMTGIAVALLGAGAGDNMTGLSVAGLGAGAGTHLTGIAIGGLAAGAGDDVRGATLALLAAGGGGDVTGLTFGGLAAGCGDRLTGLAVSGLAAGAPEIRGAAIAGLAVGGKDIRGAAIAPAWVKVESNGRLAGFTASAFNQIRGRQTGLALGIVNYAHSLNGVQIGLINRVNSNPKYFRTLPFINMHFE